MEPMISLQARLALAAAALAFLTGPSVFAAGLEKSIFWSGRYTGIVGAAQSSVKGAESLYWNPGGLGGTEGFQFNANFSPTLSKFSGPFGRNPTPQDSKTSFSPLASAFLSYGITPQLAIGLGGYVSAANKAEYDAADLGLQTVLGTTYNPPFRGNISLIEATLGAGYELVPGLRIGAGWRVLFASADLAFASIAATNLIGIHVTDLTDTEWSGVRIGLEWNPKDSPFGIGVTWRNRVNFDLDGSANVTVANAGTPGGNQALSGQAVRATTNLPMRADIAAHYRFSEAWTGFLGYTYTQYMDVDRIAITGFPGAVIPGGEADLTLNWTNMQNARIAAEYTASEQWKFRGGYVFTSQVTPKAYASPILASPGTGNTAVLGAGFRMMSELTLDGAFEYSWDSGSVAASDVPTGSSTAPGDYFANAYVLHLGATYSF